MVRQGLRKIGLMMMAILVSFLMPTMMVVEVQALSEQDYLLFYENDIMFYDRKVVKDKTTNRCRSGVTILPGGTLNEKVMAFLLSIGLNPVGAAGVYGNLMAEGLGAGKLLEHENGVDERSDIGTWYRAATYYGLNGLYVTEHDVRDLDDPSVMHGLGFAQWSFGRRVGLISALAAEGVDSYATEWDDSAGRYVYDGSAGTYDALVNSEGEDIADAILTAELGFMAGEFSGYSVKQDDISAQGIGDLVSSGQGLVEALNALETPAQSAELFFTTFEMPGSTVFNGSGGARVAHAEAGYELALQLAGEVGSTEEGDGDTKCSIVDTAILLSWDGHGHAADDPKPEYVAAMQAVGTYQKPCGGDGNGCAPIGASCDQFVSTVMRYSGVDAGFPPFGPGRQMEYMRANSSMYEEVGTGDGTEIEPGDIFVVSSGGQSHIYIYIGELNGAQSQASASYNQRTGEHFAGVAFSQGGQDFTIFRSKVEGVTY